MLLVVDIGNTSITIGLYKTDKLGPRWRLASDNERTSDEYGILMIQLLEQSGIRPEQVNEIAIASVVPPLTGTIENACRDYLNSVPLIVDAGTRTGIPLRYEDPKQVGADRVVNAPLSAACIRAPSVLWISARQPSSTLFPRKENTWAALSPQASASPPMLCSVAPQNFPGWRFCGPRRQSGATPFTRCSPVCFMAMSALSMEW